MATVSVLTDLISTFDHEMDIEVAMHSNQREENYLDHLIAAQMERDEILALMYDAEYGDDDDEQEIVNALLNDSEILALFDQGFEIDTIIAAYPELAMNKLKVLKRRWSDKMHKKKRKQVSKKETKVNDSKAPTHKMPNKQKKRRRKAKQTGNDTKPHGVHQCDWCLQEFPSEKAVRKHFKENPHMHAAI